MNAIHFTPNRRQLIAVGYNGTILTSSDGEEWTSQAPVSYMNLYDVTWQFPLIIAVGEGGIILASPDGIKWEASFPTMGWDLLSVVSSSERYVATGGYGTILSAEIVRVSGVSLNQDQLILPGNVLVDDLIATVEPANAVYKGVYWRSSDPDVVRITDGFITTGEDGTATITVTTYDGLHTAACEIIVREPINPYTVGLYDRSDGVFHREESLSLRFGPRNSDWQPLAGHWPLVVAVNQN